ncbi:MAG: acetylxylan esterase, partial [Opitutae bacterium]|nr:acetylxylan esterase [Opitutae bacterium]
MATWRGIFLLGFLFLAGAAEAQNLLPADGSFQPGGDAATLSAAAAGTPAGAAFNTGLSWERQGFHNGEPACLTVDFPAPAAWRETGLCYEFALRADRVELCVNGRRLATATGAGQRVTGELSRELLRWGGPNRLSLRVEGHQWTGGDVPDLVRVFPADGADAPITLAAEPPPLWHEYAAEEEVVLPVRLRATAEAGRVAGTLHVRVESDFHERVLALETAYVATADGAPLALRLGRLAPGFYAVSLRTTAADFSLAQDLWIAVAPTRIAAAPPAPAGLADYWDRARAELAQVAPEFRVTPEPALGTERQRVFTVAMRSVGGVELRAWLVTPARAGRYPAILHLPGYGVGMQPQWFLEGRADVVHLALDIRGHGRSAGQVNPGFGLPGFVGHQIHDAEAYVYRG